MSSKAEISGDNIIKATMEELTEDERRAYLIAEEHMRECFLQGFKKERAGLFKRVGEFVMPSFKLNNDKVDVIPPVSNEPSELIKQLSLMVDKKISDAQVAAGETLAGINDENAALKKGKSVEGDTYFPDLSLVTMPSAPDQFYGMLPNSFSRQSPPPPSVHTPSVRPFQATGLTGAMVHNPPSPTPLAAIPSSVASGRTGEMVSYTPPHTAAQQGSRPSRGPIPNTTTAYTGPNVQGVASSLQASTSSRYQANFSRFKEHLPGVLKTKLVIDMGSSRLYQKSYPPEFDFVSYLAGWRIPEFIKFNGDDSRITWEHVSQYILQLGEVGLNDALRVRLFSLSLTGTAFSCFSSLAPGSILN
ncbi:uncharacterized protein LOC120644422 isoform X1 [Panicum virgatum]|uniref:uncharacterized protein LOC120644422 isoform X1 n=1 Tax=Panicum virgatum TaxID=38727 RepID=UPI0019D5C832|nr:uncharacterized protein LOC120644422 isoform X1 [Panicum virgatum]